MAEQFDYTSIRTRILDNLATKTSHQNVFDNSAMVNMIEAICEEMEDQMLQDEYLTIENNWELAQNTSSLLTESKVHNYDVPRKVGATGTVTFGVSEDFDTYPSIIVDFPKWTQVSDDSGTLFCTVESDSLSLTDYSVDISVVQGEYKNYTTYAEGTESENFVITNDSIDNVYYDLYINDVEWEAVDTLYDYGSDDKVYKITSLSDFSGIKIQFGDGTHGQMLTSGDELYFDYVETLGEDGNTLTNESVTTVESTIYDVDSSQVEVYCTNDSSISGGESEADIDEIRENSPNFFQSGDRATTATDYETIIDAYSFIKKVSVVGAYEYNVDNGNDLWDYIDTQDNLVRVIALSTSDESLTDAQATTLTEDIQSKKAPTDILTFPDVTIIPIKFNLDVAVSSRTYTLSQVKTSIDETLEDSYSIDSLSFYESIYQSDFTSLIDAVDGVRKHNSYITLLHEDSFSVAYAQSFELPLFPIVGEDIQVYVKLSTEDENEYVLVGTGDEDGYITGEVGYTFSDLSRITLSTGVGTISITDGLTEDYGDYDLRIEYLLDSDDIVLTDRTQILEYNSSNYIDIAYYSGGE